MKKIGKRERLVRNGAVAKLPEKPLSRRRTGRQNSAEFRARVKGARRPERFAERDERSEHGPPLPRSFAPTLKERQKIKIDKTCTTLWSQMRGLMFSKKKTLLFAFKKEKRIAIHNWFVFFPINLIFLDKTRKIIEIKSNVRPFTFYTSKTKAVYLIETPEAIKVNVGDKIDMTINMTGR